MVISLRDDFFCLLELFFRRQSIKSCLVDVKVDEPRAVRECLDAVPPLPVLFVPRPLQVRVRLVLPVPPLLASRHDPAPLPVLAPPPADLPPDFLARGAAALHRLRVAQPPDAEARRADAADDLEAGVGVCLIESLREGNHVPRVINGGDVGGLNRAVGWGEPHRHFVRATLPRERVCLLDLPHGRRWRGGHATSPRSGVVVPPAPFAHRIPFFQNVVLAVFGVVFGECPLLFVFDGPVGFAMALLVGLRREIPMVRQAEAPIRLVPPRNAGCVVERVGIRRFRNHGPPPHDFGRFQRHGANQVRFKFRLPFRPPIDADFLGLRHRALRRFFHHLPGDAPVTAGEGVEVDAIAGGGLELFAAGEVVGHGPGGVVVFAGGDEFGDVPDDEGEHFGMFLQVGTREHGFDGIHSRVSAEALFVAVFADDDGEIVRRGILQEQFGVGGVVRDAGCGRTLRDVVDAGAAVLPLESERLHRRDEVFRRQRRSGIRNGGAGCQGVQRFREQSEKDLDTLWTSV